VDGQTEGLRPSYLRFLRVGLFLGISPLFYIAVIELLKVVQDPFGGILSSQPQLVPILRYAFIALAAGDLALIWFFRDRALLTVPETGLSQEGFVAVPVGRLFAVSVVICALCEVVAAFGLILFLMAGKPWDFYGFAVYSLLLFALFFPRYQQWEVWARGPWE
jgi:hypothetical protein